MASSAGGTCAAADATRSPRISEAVERWPYLFRVLGLLVVQGRGEATFEWLAKEIGDALSDGA